MSAVSSQITSLTIVYSSVYSGADQRKHQSSASLAFVRVIHRSPVNSPHKRPVTRKMFPFDDVIMFFSTEGFIRTFVDSIFKVDIWLHSKFLFRSVPRSFCELIIFYQFYFYSILLRCEISLETKAMFIRTFCVLIASYYWKYVDFIWNYSLTFFIFWLLHIKPCVWAHSS